MAGNTEFDAQRAILNAELTAVALAGGDTAKVRKKLQALDDREQAARDAESAAREAERRQRVQAAADIGLQRATSAIERLAAQGHVVAEHEAQNLRHTYSEIARLDAEIEIAGEARVAVNERSEQIEARIELLQARADALAGLRLTGQASERDLTESTMLLQDICTLQEALADAKARAAEVRIPEDLLARRAAEWTQAGAIEVSVAQRCIRDQLAQTEVVYLDLVRQLMDATGATHPTACWQPGTGLSWLLRTGALPR
ncbi:hypothetical protein [Ralstonia pseudosolanacearum]|uniref:hypothetical protein n=1 Tax=Ralstonia pseudosolanacearum TaxID=1310165 RepID=UPI002674C618|nr:hypothetical protein [Ralstonia pseudosolanacearum]MDO3518143.1 hypothetical protein [Ralstonia pseudosolanacearum]MDO3540662.1 hypothetical protein [Ralstonia pseudosolanacearum]